MMAKRESSNRAERGIASDRTDKALESAARWLRRRGLRREKRATRQAYTDAAAVITSRLRRR